MKLIVVKSHRSEYPEPISFTKGTRLEVGEEYRGSEGWENWYFCNAQGQGCGWVPAQVIEELAPGIGRALEDYTANELNVDPEEALLGLRQLNGWVWCSRLDGSESGWVPISHLRQVDA